MTCPQTLILEDGEDEPFMENLPVLAATVRECDKPTKDDASAHSLSQSQNDVCPSSVGQRRSGIVHETSHTASQVTRASQVGTSVVC